MVLLCWPSGSRIGCGSTSGGMGAGREGAAERWAVVK